MRITSLYILALLFALSTLPVCSRCSNIVELYDDGCEVVDETKCECTKSGSSKTKEIRARKVSQETKKSHLRLQTASSTTCSIDKLTALFSQGCTGAEVKGNQCVCIK